MTEMLSGRCHCGAIHFTLPQPSPHRTALVLTAVVFVLVLALNLILGPLTAGWPLPLRSLLTVTLQVILMT